MNGKERRQGQESKAFPRATDILESLWVLVRPLPAQMITLWGWEWNYNTGEVAWETWRTCALSLWVTKDDLEWLEVLIKADSSSGKGPSGKTRQTLMSQELNSVCWMTGISTGEGFSGGVPREALAPTSVPACDENRVWPRERFPL